METIKIENWEIKKSKNKKQKVYLYLEEGIYRVYANKSYYCENYDMAFCGEYQMNELEKIIEDYGIEKKNIFI